MEQLTSQEQEWNSEFGQAYTDRSIFNTVQLDAYYQTLYGVPRGQMNEEFINTLDKDIRILEVGCNVGNQLNYLQSMGFNNLFGIDIQEYAVQVAQKNTSGMTITQNSAQGLPYKDEEFDLVYTSGVLIHISPDDIGNVIGEIVRCTKKWVWGLEYYADELTPINYRNNRDLLWKRNFCKLYTDTFPELELVNEKKYQYTANTDMDQMFLLRK